MIKPEFFAPNRNFVPFSPLEKNRLPIFGRVVDIGWIISVKARFTDGDELCLQVELLKTYQQDECSKMPAPHIALAGLGANLQGLTWESAHRLRIGRQTQADIVLSDFSVDRIHAEIRHQGLRW